MLSPTYNRYFQDIAIPTPFMLLELLVGLIQASVFAMLTLVYMSVAVSEPHGAH